MLYLFLVFLACFNSLANGVSPLVASVQPNHANRAVTYVYGSGRHGAAVSGRTAPGIQLLPTVLLGDEVSSATFSVQHEGYGGAEDLEAVLRDVRRCWALTSEANGAVAIPVPLVNDQARSLAAHLRVGTLITGLVLEGTDLRPYYAKVIDTNVARQVPHCLMVTGSRVPLGALLREADIDASFHGEDVDRPVNATVDMWGDGSTVESSVKRGVHNFVVPDNWNTFRWNSGSPSLSWPGGARVSCVGCFAEFRPSLDIQLQIRSSWEGLLPEVTVSRARTVAGGSLSFGLTVEGSVVGVASWRSRSRKLYGPVPLGSASGTVFWIGPVPVYVRPEAEVSLKVALRSVARVTARVGGTATVNARLGVDYRRGQRPTTISSGRGSFRPTASFRVGSARSSVTTGIKGELELEVKVHIYEVITVGLGLSLPAIIVDTHFRHASCNNGPQYEVKAGVDVGTSLTFFEGEIFEGTSVSSAGDAPFLSEFTLLQPRLLTSGCFRRTKRMDPGTGGEMEEEIALSGFEDEKFVLSSAPDVAPRTMEVTVVVNGAGDLEISVFSETEATAVLFVRGCATADCTELTDLPAVTGPALGLPALVTTDRSIDTIQLSDKPTAALLRSMVGSDTFMVLAITGDEDDDDHDGPTAESLPVTLSPTATSGVAVPAGSATSYLVTAFSSCSARCGPTGMRTREARHGSPPADLLTRSCNTEAPCPTGDMGVRATFKGERVNHWGEVPVATSASIRTLKARDEPTDGSIGVKLGGATLGKPLTLDIASALCGAMMPDKLALPSNGAPDLSKRQVDIAPDASGLSKIGRTVMQGPNGNPQIPYHDDLLFGDEVVTYTDDQGNEVVSGKWDWLTYDPAANDAKSRTYNWQLKPSLTSTSGIPQTTLHSIRYSEWSTGGCLERTDPSPPVYSTVRRRWQVGAVDIIHDPGSPVADTWLNADATFIGVLSLRVSADTLEELNGGPVEDPGNVYAVYLAIPEGVTSALGEVHVSVLSSSTDFVTHNTIQYELRASLADVFAVNSEWRTDGGVFLGCRRVSPCISDECIKCGTEYAVDARGRCITEGPVEVDHSLATGGTKCAGGGQPPFGSGFRVDEASEGLSSGMLAGIIGGAVAVGCCCLVIIVSLCCMVVVRSRRKQEQRRQQQSVLSMQQQQRTTSARRLASRSQSKRSGVQRGARVSGRNGATATSGQGVASTRGIHRQQPPAAAMQKLQQPSYPLQQPQVHHPQLQAAYAVGTPGAPSAPRAPAQHFY